MTDTQVSPALITQPAPPTTVLVGGMSSGVPIAVIGFGFSILTFGVFNIGAVDMGAFPFFPYVAMYCGAIAMAFGGIWEARSANVFGATFSMAYACFLVTTGVLVQYVQPQVVGAAGQAAFNEAFAAWLFLWTVFTALFAIGAWYINLPALLAFVLLAVAYFAAGVAAITTGNVSTAFTRIAGWVALGDGIAAWYLGVGILLNGMSGRTMFPMREHVSK